MSKLILFQGDSVTEWRRDVNDPNDLGAGYPPAVAEYYAKNKELRFCNRGVSGDRICHIRARWAKDCIDLKPDILCLFAGVNDVLVQLYEGFMTPHGDFLRDYRFVMDEVKAKLPKTKIIIAQPFMLKTDDRIAGIADYLEPIKGYVKRFAVEYADAYIAIADKFDSVVSAGFGAKSLAEDGVHPTAFGYYIITNLFIEAIDKIL